ncbi:MAG: hypothetical protein IPJ88_13240 [Myxococcales bacterium]|nr:MAG: hypothetical protein IPJ88_13240 [Myxococcales bacterium]
MKPVVVLTNPKSRKNRNRPNRVRQLQAVAGDLAEVHAPQSMEQLRALLASWASAMPRYVVIDGGDGTLHCYLREFVNTFPRVWESHAMPAVLITPSGTINFVASHLGHRVDCVELLRQLNGRLVSGFELPIEMVPSLDITVRDQDGDERRLLAFACSPAGVGPRFFKHYYASSRPGVSTACLLIARLLVTMPFSGSAGKSVIEPLSLTVSVDGRTLPQSSFNLIGVASIPINLKLFRLFFYPDSPQKLSIIVGSPSLFGILKNIPRMIIGSKLRDGQFGESSGAEMLVEGLDTVSWSAVIEGDVYNHLSFFGVAQGPPIPFVRLGTK